MNLVNSEIRNSLIAECISELTWEMDLLEKRVYVSEAWKQFLGYNDNLYSNPHFWHEIIHPEDLDSVIKSAWDHIEGRKAYHETKYRIKIKSGIYKWIFVRAKAHFNEEGKAVYIAGFNLDVTTYADLRESEARYENIVELSPNGAVIEQDGTIIFANEHSAKILEAPSKEALIGRRIRDFIHPDFIESALERRYTVLNGKTAPSAEMKLIKYNGQTIHAEVAAIPMKYREKTNTLSIIRDVTESKAIQEENERLLSQTLEYDRLKTEFFANISHELRTPLNVIISSIQLLNGTYSSCNHKQDPCFVMLNKYMGVMKQNSYRLLKLINNLIDITRIDAGFYKSNFKKQNIVEIAENITLSVVPYGEQKNINIVFDTDFEERYIACDEEKLERILLNLLSNAIKFTPPGGYIKVNVGENEENVLISVKDTGSGIPYEKLQVIFERFRQVDEVLTKRAEGSGIGLALVKALVEICGGKISVKSTAGQGSEFLIQIPKSAAEALEEIAITNVSNLEENIGEKINIELSDIYL